MRVHKVQINRPAARKPASQGRAGASRLPHNVSADFTAWLARRRAGVESAFSTYLKEVETVIGSHSRLAAAVQYSVNAGGKRLRPILVLECCRICGGRREVAIPVALAMELVHTFSLIHDDLPAMDDDDTRRGKPTSHKVFGEALAILAGDWLVTRAFGLLASERVGPALCPRLVSVLAEATQRMIEGQAADVEGEGRLPDPQLVQYIHRRKTAALIEACCRLGALCAGASSDALEALATYGRHLGLAFQIADDLLDATGLPDRMGKQAGKDAVAGKQTYPAAFGLEESRAQAAREVAEAIQALKGFGSRADRLRDLARYAIARDR